MTRCEFCGIPIQQEGRVPFCSERCLLYDTLGVPILKEEEITIEIVQNQHRDRLPSDWTPPTAYPSLDEYDVWADAKHAILEAIATSHDQAKRTGISADHGA